MDGAIFGSVMRKYFISNIKYGGGNFYTSLVCGDFCGFGVQSYPGAGLLSDQKLDVVALCFGFEDFDLHFCAVKFASNCLKLKSKKNVLEK